MMGIILPILEVFGGVFILILLFGVTSLLWDGRENKTPMQVVILEAEGQRAKEIEAEVQRRLLVAEYEMRCKEELISYNIAREELKKIVETEEDVVFITLFSGEQMEIVFPLELFPGHDAAFSEARRFQSVYSSDQFIPTNKERTRFINKLQVQSFHVERRKKGIQQS